MDECVEQPIVPMTPSEYLLAAEHNQVGPNLIISDSSLAEVLRGIEYPDVEDEFGVMIQIIMRPMEIDASKPGTGWDRVVLDIEKQLDSGADVADVIWNIYSRFFRDAGHPMYSYLQGMFDLLVHYTLAYRNAQSYAISINSKH